MELVFFNVSGCKCCCIVDPSSKQIIACFYDQTCPGSSSANGTGSKDVSCIEQEADSASSQSDADGVANNVEHLFPRFSADECSDLYYGVFCRNPWDWTEQRLYHQHSELKCGNNYLWQPLRHSALVAIGTAVAVMGSHSPEHKISRKSIKFK